MSRQMYWDEEAQQLFPVDDVPQEPVNPTNADRIRSMSDEELAEELRLWGDGVWTYEDWLGWLKEEVKK